MIFRPKMFRELQKARCLDAGLLVTSLWSGTVKKEMDCIQTMKAAGMRYDHVHTSGHATENELQQFVDAFPNSRIVPIHLEDREGFRRLSPIGNKKRSRVVGGLGNGKQRYSNRNKTNRCRKGADKGRAGLGTLVAG